MTSCVCGWNLRDIEIVFGVGFDNRWHPLYRVRSSQLNTMGSGGGGPNETSAKRSLIIVVVPVEGAVDGR